MEHVSKTFLNSSSSFIKTTFEDNTLGREMYENIENLPRNEQSVQYDLDDLNKYGKKEHRVKVDDDKDQLPENLQESNTKTHSAYKVLEDSYIKYSDCGEPLKPQHINIDFTPIPGVDDNAFLQQKCIDFWKFVNGHPKLLNFEKEKVDQSSKHKTITDKISVEQCSSQGIEIPAIKVLKRPDIYQKALATKLKYTVCEHSDNDYSLGDTRVEQQHVKSKIPSKFSDPQYNVGLKPRLGVKNKSSIIKSRGLDEVKKLCHKMEEWDLSHPTSMEPPNRVPSLSDLK